MTRGGDQLLPEVPPMVELSEPLKELVGQGSNAKHVTGALALAATSGRALLRVGAALAPTLATLLIPTLHSLVQNAQSSTWGTGA